MPALQEKVQAGIDYPAILDAAWRDAMAPRGKDAPTVVSLFAGCGGSSLGYAMAGYDERLAVEWDDHAAETFRANFPRVSLYHGDIAKLSTKEALIRARVREGELDVLDGSPPCQGFSTAGLRILDDPRNQLFCEFVRLLRAFKPKALVMENVPGMKSGKMRPVFSSAIRALRESGYNVSACVLNAKWYGVPQNRQRIIFIGTRSDVKAKPSHPFPSHRTITLLEATRGIDVHGPELPGRTRILWAQCMAGERYSSAMRKLGARGSWFSMRRMAWGLPSPTIVKTTPTMMHPDEPFFLSIDALKRISSVPDGFVLSGSFGKQWERLGNIVPPLLMRAISTHVRGLISR